MGEARSGQGRRRVARPRWHRCATVAALVVLPVVGLLAPPAAQAVGTAYVVDGSAAACSDTGPGTPAQPFCTIGAATRKSLVPGDSVTIAPGVYREQVNVPSSGTPAAPITFRASGPGVLVLGTKDLGSSAWTAAAAPAPAVAWQTAFAPASTPRQVFLAGTRLSQAASASTMGTSSWFYDSAAKVLLVDLGGPSPAGQLVEAGAQSYGLSVVGRHDVLLTGIDTRGANYAGVRVNSSTGIQVSALTADQGGSNGVLVEAASSSVVLDGLTVTNAVSTGIRVSSSSAVTVRSSDADHNGLHGIGVTSSPQLVLTGNTSHDNAATSGTSTAAGIDVSGSSTDAQVVGNTVYGNQDTGIQIGSGADRPLVARNLSHHNGDHGIHVLGALNASLISNSVTANKREGVALEGGATGARLADNLLTDNGQGGGEADLLVDAGSQTGLVADYDLAWNPTTRTAVRAGSTSYKSLLDYAATTGQEAHGLASDPGFADPANGDLRLTAGSVAVDSADAGVPGFVGTAPWTPVDDPAVPDRGAGVPTFADRGALEYLEVGSANHPPHAALMLNPAQVAVPPSAQVSVDASGSSDPDDYPIQSYAFDFGDGTSSAPQPGPVTSHAYDTPGTYTVTVTVTDTAGAVGTARATEVVTARAANDYWVDRGNTACSDAGPGSPGQPFCTIGAGTRKALAGDTVHVAAGTYPEQVSFPRGGEAGAPLTVLGAPGVLVTGANATTGAAGARSYGLVLRNISHVVVSGFAVSSVAITGILLDTVSDSSISGIDAESNGAYGVSIERSSNVVATGVTAASNASTGIRLLTCTDCSLISGVSHNNAFHGVSVQGSTRAVVRGVSAYANLRPSSRSATGIDVSAGSADTLVEDNRTWGNDDSGIEAYTDAHGTVIRRNISWNNGDHGIDNYRAPSSLIVSNTVVGNTTAGINLEGGSTNGTVRDNVTMDNAIGSPRTIGEIRVDSASQPGTTLDDDLVFKSSSGALFEWQAKPYTSLASFRAVSGQEPNGLSADPVFTSRATGDFSLGPTSPAIDAAQAGVAGWTPADQTGSSPVDDPGVADTGTGTPPYADLGALELIGPFTPTATATSTATRK